MKNKNTKIGILGTTYKVLFKSSDEEPRLQHNWGFTDHLAKEIYISTECEKETDDTCKNLKEFRNKVLRHEIIHAFLCESGLKECSYDTIAWAYNEEMIDWFAIQSPKIFKIYKQLNILGRDI